MELPKYTEPPSYNETKARSQCLFHSIFADKSVIGITGIIFQIKHYQRVPEFVNYYETELNSLMKRRCFNPNCEFTSWKTLTPIFASENEFGLTPIKISNVTHFYKIFQRYLAFCKKNNYPNVFQRHTTLLIQRYELNNQDIQFMIQNTDYVKKLWKNEHTLRMIVRVFLENLEKKTDLSKYNINFYELSELIDESHHTLKGFKTEVKNRVLINN